MARSFLFGVLTFVLLGASQQVDVYGQGILDDLYGQGVHAYFEGDYESAAQWLGQAEAQGTQDPRAYYFLGLTHLGLGETDQANASFARGAEIETAGTERYFPIADSLARVQGSARVSLERARRAARTTARERELARRKARYEETLQAEARVLRGAEQPVAEVPNVEMVGEIALPFPGVQADPQAATDFSVLGGPSLADLNVAKEPSPLDPPTAGAADPADPFAVNTDPAPMPADPMPGDPFGVKTDPAPMPADPSRRPRGDSSGSY